MERSTQVKSLGMVQKVGEVPPKHGEHTAEVLRDLGYEDEKIDELRKKGIV